MEIKLDSTVKGTRILYGDSSAKKRKVISEMARICFDEELQEVMFPVIQQSGLFNGKVGGENQKMMYRFTDPGGRERCVAPEYTAAVMEMSATIFRDKKDEGVCVMLASGLGAKHGKRVD